ncbi:hypothetical protein FHS96_005907 [Sphingomonas zeicaulis]|uniref:hypothetical protein n=1 Tax=Sphingomonas zeicaulis TaxID=1632740 RepID=UPI003D197AD2
MRLNLRALFLVFLTLLEACGNLSSESRSICSMNGSRSNWNSTHVTWKGIIIGSPEHGYLFLNSDCPKKKIGLEFAKDKTWSGFTKLNDTFDRPVIIKGTVIGEINADHLVVNEIDNFMVQKMTFEEKLEYLRWLGLAE